MADKRMFSKSIIDSDLFMEMESTTQLLYFHLSMRADDDGFINKPKTIMRMIGCKEDDLKALIENGYIILFDSGVVAIRHWKVNNSISKDRYHNTVHKEELEMLQVADDKTYSLNDTESNTDCIQNDNNLYTDCMQNDNNLYTDCMQNDNSDLGLGLDLDKKEKDKKEKVKLADAQTPFFENAELNNTFLEFIKMRKSLKNGKMTDRAIAMMVNKLGKYDDNTAIAMLNQSILNNWKDVYPLKTNDSQQQVKKNQFNSFPQRDYSKQDYADLEKRLLDRGT